MTTTAVSIQVVGARQLLARLGGKKAAVRRVFRRAHAQSWEYVLAVAADSISSASNASPAHRATHLGVVTGTLRKRLTYVVDPSGAFSRGGSPTVYAPRHEFGFQGMEQVRAHVRHITQAFGKPLRAPRGFLEGPKSVRGAGGRFVHVRAFTRQAYTPARPFMRPALHDSGEMIERIFSRNIAEALAGAAVAS